MLKYKKTLKSVRHTAYIVLFLLTLNLQKKLPRDDSTNFIISSTASAAKLQKSVSFLLNKPAKLNVNRDIAAS